MRLMHVVDSLELGGLERIVTDLAIAQRDRGHDVSVFSLLDTQGFADELRAAGVDVVIGAKSRPFDLALLGRMRRTVARKRIDVLHAHSFVPNYHAAAATLGLRGAPVLVGTCHDMGKRLSQRKLRWMYRWSMRRTAGVAMVGRQVHDTFVQRGLASAEKATTVLNGVPFERFASTPARRAAARRVLGIADGAIVIGAVGRLVELKNHRLLLDVFARLLPHRPRLRLVIVGAGPLRDELSARAAQLGITGSVTFTGARSDVADLLPAFDVFAMPSSTEGLSIALLEACATGLAIVATAVGGNPEIIRDGHNGRLIAAGDAQALQAALDDLLWDEPLRRRLAESAREWVRANASLDAVCAAYDRFYLRALRAPA
jgi:glycosyltransferase involved in cell wall biosynthesis